MKKCWQSVAGVLAIVLAMLACGGQSDVKPISFANTPTPTSTKVLATQTPYIVQITITPLPTLTPTRVLAKCVQADVTVYLRPSANTSGYPIEVLANGEQIVDLGGRVGKWWFVSHGSNQSNQGWVDSNYLRDCDV